LSVSRVRNTGSSDDNHARSHAVVSPPVTLWAVMGVIESDSFVIANSGDHIEQVFSKTRWAGGPWQRELRRLPGTLPTQSIRFNGVVRRGTRIPSDYLTDSYRMTRFAATETGTENDAPYT
jgi:hypothetical protein